MINEILIWVYLINFVFLMMHETDASYWKEWRLFGKWGKSLSDKQGLSIFILARLPICIPLLYGMLNLNHQSGLIISAILSVFLIFHFFIHMIVRKLGRSEFAWPISYFIQFGMLILSSTQLYITVQILIKTNV